MPPFIRCDFAWSGPLPGRINSGRLLLRLEFIQQRHYGMKLMAYFAYQREAFLRCLKLATS